MMSTAAWMGRYPSRLEEKRLVRCDMPRSRYIHILPVALDSNSCCNSRMNDEDRLPVTSFSLTREDILEGVISPPLFPRSYYPEPHSPDVNCGQFRR